jgi:hypothetical protein
MPQAIRFQAPGSNLGLFFGKLIGAGVGFSSVVGRLNALEFTVLST